MTELLGLREIKHPSYKPLETSSIKSDSELTDKILEIHNLLLGEAKEAENENFITVTLDYHRWRIIWVTVGTLNRFYFIENPVICFITDQLGKVLDQCHTAFATLEIPPEVYTAILAVLDTYLELKRLSRYAD